MEKLLNKEVRKVQYANRVRFAKVIRRTFEALKFPIDSERRQSLNKNVVSSEYMPSLKYTVSFFSPSYGAYDSIAQFRTKKEAQLYLESISI